MNPTDPKESLRGFGWFFESPLKGAIRGGCLWAATMGLFGLVGVLRGGYGAKALPLVLWLAVGGAVAGGLMHAFFGWLIGPILKELAQKRKELSRRDEE
jgi:hypothetical protein